MNSKTEQSIGVMEGREGKRGVGGGGDESQESAVISHETKAHTAQLWLEFHTLSHLSVPRRLRAQLGPRLLRDVCLKLRADLQQPCPGSVFNPLCRLHTSVSVWPIGRVLCLADLSFLSGAHD